MPGNFITLTAADGHSFSAYQVLPTGMPRGGLVVIQEIFGVNTHIRDVADRFAAQGYAVIAPALYDRIRPQVELGYTPADVEAARSLRATVPTADAIADITAAAAALKDYGKVGVIGYCWGGTLAWLSAALVPGLSAAIGYYAGGIGQQIDQAPQTAVMLHFGERDKMIPLADAEALKARYPEITVHVYPADHGFNCDHRASYDADSAALALERSLGFFSSHL